MSDVPALFDSALDAVSAITVALIAAGMLGVRSRVKRVQAQVENDHTTNMREEADERHQENSRALRWLVATVQTVVRDIGGIRQDLRDLRAEVRHERDRIDDLEDTINPKEKP